MEDMKKALVRAEQLEGKRKPKDGESDYLKNLMCSSMHTSVNVFMLLLAVCMIILPAYGLYGLLMIAIPTFIENGELDGITIAVSIFAVLLLFIIFCCGVKLPKNIISDQKREKALKADIANGCFSVIDVRVTEWHRRYDPDSSESTVTIEDYKGNVADSEFVTVNWPEIKNNGDKGVVVVMENGNEPKVVFHAIYPCYNENSSFCRHWKRSQS